MCRSMGVLTPGRLRKDWAEKQKAARGQHSPDVDVWWSFHSRDTDRGIRPRAATSHACSINDPQRSITFRSSLLREKRLTCRAANCSIRLRNTSRSRQSAHLRGFRPLWWTKRSRLCYRSRLHHRSCLRHRSLRTFRQAHGCGREVLSEFQTEIPNPLI